MSLEHGPRPEIKEKEQFKDVSIFTSTMYGNDEQSRVRQKLALRLLEKANGLGVRCAVSDTNSNQDFLNAVQAMDNVSLITLDPKLTMGQGRREALKFAMQEFDTPFYLWIEPEKDNLVTAESLHAMVDKLREGVTDIVVPKRANMSSLPPFQVKLEKLANQRAKELMVKHGKVGETLDLWFGPKMFNQVGAEYFVNYDGKLDKWDSIIAPVLRAHADGVRVNSAPVRYVYPPAQSSAEIGNEEMQKKRVTQYQAILAEMGDEFWKAKLAQSKT